MPEASLFKALATSEFHSIDSEPFKLTILLSLKEEEALTLKQKKTFQDRNWENDPPTQKLNLS